MFAEKSNNQSLKEIISYTYPKLYTGKEWYIGFYAFDPVIGKMRRKKIKLNYIEKIAERRKYASALMRRLQSKLDQGWNPWIEAENSKAFTTWEEACSRYHSYTTKMYNDGNLREKTMYGYLSMLKILKEWNTSRLTPIIYIYQFNRTFVSEFLDYIYIDKNNSIRTRNNYLTWLSVFDGYLTQRGYITTKATEGITCIKKNSYEKDREIIPDKDMQRLHDYLEEKNKYYLLACYVLHYTLIRPREMSFLKLEDINLKKQTIYISGQFAKNKRNAIVTLPAKVIRLMLDLQIFQHPGQYYLFSDNFQPGPKQKSEKAFRDYWDHHVRKDLKFPMKYKFYSLKDTGITAMLRCCDTLTVRDQARHSSILMTNIYTPQDIKDANELLLNYEGCF